MIARITKTDDKARSPKITKKNMSCEVVANTKQAKDIHIRAPNTEYRKRSFMMRYILRIKCDQINIKFKLLLT